MPVAVEPATSHDVHASQSSSTSTFMGCCAIVVLLLSFHFFCFASLVGGAGMDSKQWAHHITKISGVIIPGFASTRLRAWALLDCPFSPLDFRPLDPVWLDTKKVISVPNCWLKCMVLDPYNQTDHSECKSRPDSGLAAITELDPGYITGPLSSVWREWVNWCVEFGIEADAIIAAPYDWRLSGIMLEERDLYFSRLKQIFELAFRRRGGPSLVFAHSLGNNVFRYFLEWLKLEVAPNDYQKWLDDHIHTYFAVGAPFLGAVESVKATLSGLTFGLPISESTARLMCNSFSSSIWMLPFSSHCDARHKPLQSVWGQHGSIKDGSTFMCGDKENSIASSGWPVDIVKVEVPEKLGAKIFPNDALSDPYTNMDCCLTTQWSFSAREVADGTFFGAIGDHDVNSKQAHHQLETYFLNDPVLNPLTPWQRPELKNIFCIYGIDLKTEVGYNYALSGKPYPDNWILTDVIYENEGVLQSRSGTPVSGKPSASSGDGTVPYHSLSWCKTWLGPSVNITRTPQHAYDASDVQTSHNVEHQNGEDIIPNMMRENNVKYMTFYEDGESLTGKRTAVWEIDKVDHRNIVRFPVLLRELWLETSHEFHPDAKRQFVSKVKREPIRDEDCFWDYSKARCGMPNRCEYRYVFGDVHLGQSCRLRASSENLFQHYL